ncbi:hypothetical protein [Streptomyces boluensis]|uniref:Uncharacterized protein n=1 Tax=Streptomyces boluensis TaxID=1775135 RepID=A0A964UP46_9ACTN|nr:hypothetical protein [Streptomyces boluensis]NBE52212.1 hypothetical protein [Streptomyces boluensis]
MAGVSGAARVALWVVAVVAGVVSVGLIVSLVVNPEAADRTASVTGAVVGLAALVVSVIGLVRAPGGNGVRRVRAGRGGVAAGGDAVGNATGRGSKVVGAPSAPRPGAPYDGDADVRSGRGGVAAAGDVRDNAVGDESERS